MASEIHKKRTGKGFRINEEIVLKEEMYEEEDEDLPRSFRLLGAHMNTSSASMNNRLGNFVNNKVAMTSLLAKTNDDWRENEINKLFEQSFGKITSAMPRQQPQPQPQLHQPHAEFAQQQQVLHMQQPQALQQPQQQPMPISMAEHSEMIASPISPAMMDFPPTQLPSAMSQAPQLPAHPVMGPHPQGHPRGQSVSIMPPAFNGYVPMRHSSETPQTEPFSQFNDRHTDSPIDLAPGQRSAFTHDMPPEMRLMMEQQGVVDPEMQLQEWMMMNAINAGHFAQPGKLDVYSPAESPMAMHPGMMAVPIPTMPVDESWKSFIDEAAWGAEQQEVQQ